MRITANVINIRPVMGSRVGEMFEVRGRLEYKIIQFSTQIHPPGGAQMRCTQKEATVIIIGVLEI
jgi:hypothetical protein